MPIKIISPSQENEIRQYLLQGKRPKEISELMELKYTTLWMHIQIMTGKKNERRPQEARMPEAHYNGIFNVHARENWLI